MHERKRDCRIMRWRVSERKMYWFFIEFVLTFFKRKLPARTKASAMENLRHFVGKFRDWSYLIFSSEVRFLDLCVSSRDFSDLHSSASQSQSICAMQRQSRLCLWISMRWRDQVACRLDIVRLTLISSFRSVCHWTIYPALRELPERNPLLFLPSVNLSFSREYVGDCSSSLSLDVYLLGYRL